MRLQRFAPGVLFLLIFLQACSRPDDTVIRETIMAMKQSAEAGKWPEVMGHISRHYKDKHGNNYFIITQMIKGYVSDVQELKVDLEVMGVSISEKEARAQIKLVVRGKRYDKIYYVVGNEQDPEYPKLWLAKEGRNTWRIVRVEGVDNNRENPF